MTAAYCFDCGHDVRGSLAEHRFTKAHQAEIAPRISRRRERPSWALSRGEEWYIDDEAVATGEWAELGEWKRCSGIPSLGIADHFEPLEAFPRNRAYSDGYYIRCREHHRQYQAAWRARRRAATELECAA